jgi:serine phosphatase RsbU (regulator of sigma subunit)/CheY-like chemotaxis protein
MIAEPLHILLLEDYQLDAELVKIQLTKTHPEWQIDHVSSKEGFEDYISQFQPDVVLSDYSLPQFTGMEAFIKIKEQGLEIPFIIVTGDLPEHLAVECMEQGIDDYIIKSSMLRLSVAIDKAIDKRRIAENLRESESRQKAIFQYAAVAITAFACPGLQKRMDAFMAQTDQKISDLHVANLLKGLNLYEVNQEALKLFKAGDKIELKKKFLGLFDAEITSIVANCLMQAHQGKEIIEYEISATTVSSKELYLKMRVAVDGENVDTFNVSFIDLTEIKRSEKRVTRVLEKLEFAVETRTRELKEANIKMLAQAEERELSNQVMRDNYIQITDSIIAAKRIQQLMLPKVQHIQDFFADAFIYHRPKDIVSGDFYWFHEDNDTCWIACVDCTGHGVPGAFMSMISSKLLNQIVIEHKTENCGEILKQIDNYVILELKQHDSETRVSTGMDISICCFDKKKNEVRFAGAYHQLFHIHNNELQILKGNRCSLGGTFKMEDKDFQEQTLPMEAGDTVYMLTDGFVDQFGGPKNKKFTKKRWIRLLEAAQGRGMYDQEMMIKGALQDWKGAQEQIDDILVIGLQY